jgi:hypothetical protein
LDLKAKSHASASTGPLVLAPLIASVRTAFSYPLYTADVKEYLAENDFNVEATIKAIAGSQESSETSDSEITLLGNNALDATPQNSTQVISTSLPQSTSGLVYSNKTSQVSSVRPGPTFMTLPRELRDQIYGVLFIHNKAIKVHQTSFSVGVKSKPTFPIVALSRTCKQVAEECLRIFYGQNTFRLDLNILTAIDWLKTVPITTIKGRMKSITLAKTIMTGYVRIEYGLYDSSRLRNELVRGLIYDFDIATINLEVPDETPPANTANNPFNTLLHYHPSREYSWSLTREFCDTLLAGGAEELRLCYPITLPSTMHSDLIKLNAVSKLLYMDDDFEISAIVKRLDTAREHGRRKEFTSKADIERYVRERRAVRRFELRAEAARGFEKGTAVVITRPSGRRGEQDEFMDEGLGMGRRQRRELSRDLFPF